MSSCRDSHSEEKKAAWREKYKAMTHEERMAEYKKMRRAGMGMLGAGVGVFGGLAVGLSYSMGAGAAIGTAFGACSGLIFGSKAFRAAKEILAIDQELGGGEEDKQETEVV